MLSNIRVLGLAAPLALVFMVGAPAAMAITGSSEDECGLPSDVAGDIGTPEIFLDEKLCKKSCKELDKLCKNLVKNREQCIKDIDKALFSLDDLGCDEIEDKDDRKACKDEIKGFEKQCKSDLKDDSKQGKDNCKDAYGKKSDCVSFCTNPA